MTLYQELFNVVKKVSVDKCKEYKNPQERTNELWKKLKEESKNPEELAQNTRAKINELQQDFTIKKATIFNNFFIKVILL